MLSESWWEFMIESLDALIETLLANKSIQQFIDLYWGGEYEIHYIYARILNIVFVTFMYGLALPILFPTALVSMIVLYYVQKLSIIYYCKEPPSYNEKLNKTAIKIMVWAPMFMYLFGYWMMSNRQIFTNHVVLNDQANPSYEKTDHTLFKDMSEGPAINLFVMICLFPLWFIGYYVISKLAPRFKIFKRLVLSPKETLPNYFDALNEKTQGIFINEEVNVMRMQFGIKTVLDSTLAGILGAKQSHRKISGVGYYDMLADIRYQEKFQYFILHEETLSSSKKDSHFVRHILNLAFQPKNAIESIHRSQLNEYNVDDSLSGMEEIIQPVEMQKNMLLSSPMLVKQSSNYDKPDINKNKFNLIILTIVANIIILFLKE